MPGKTKQGDKFYRSLIKAVTWRLTASIDTLIISFIIIRKLKWAATISGIEIFTKILWYYLHERIWNRISFGKRNRSDSGRRKT
jgi:uncharacterized membrane protein